MLKVTWVLQKKAIWQSWYYIRMIGGLRYMPLETLELEVRQKIILPSGTGEEARSRGYVGIGPCIELLQ
jgi:hypothetical protein